MPDEKLDNQKDELHADLKRRFGDLLEQRGDRQLERGQGKGGRWAVIKDRLAIVAVIVVLAFVVFMMIDGSVVNFRCTFAEFVTLECNRWAGEEHPSLRR